MKLPFLLLTDNPTLTSGLARIGRDVMRRLLPVFGDRLDLAQLSVQPVGRWGWQEWPLYVVDDLATYGAETIQDVWRDLYGDRVGILFTIWDAARVIDLNRVDGPWVRWGYVPVDSANLQGGFSGPAAEAIGKFDRVLAYGRWGSRILKSVRSEPVPYLPHGLDDLWQPRIRQDAYDAIRAVLQPKDGTWILGMVATNQPRKDLAIFFQTVAELRRRGHPVQGWLHTDALVQAWSVPQLVVDCGLAKRAPIVSVTTDLSDAQLAAAYAACKVTMLSSLGEGFGYPIVESLASGTPCVHTTFGGGAELVPRSEWRVPVRGMRLEGLHAQQRPVYDPTDWANAVERAAAHVDADPIVSAHVCAWSVRHLRWDALWPRWRSWVAHGLDSL